MSEDFARLVVAAAIALAQIAVAGVIAMNSSNPVEAYLVSSVTFLVAIAAKLLLDNCALAARMDILLSRAATEPTRNAGWQGR